MNEWSEDGSGVVEWSGWMDGVDGVVEWSGVE